MPIIHGHPPNWEKILERFPGIDEKYVLVTYGGKIYQPGTTYVHPIVMEHEAVHAHQQGDNPDLWWAKYLSDPEFLLAQEAEAYGKQHRMFCMGERDRNKRIKHLYHLARELSGPTYGNPCSHMHASSLIKDAARI